MTPKPGASRRRLSLGAAILWLALLWAAPGPGAAFAQAPPDQLLRRVAGPYDVAVSAQPPRPVEGLGGPRFSVAVLSSAGGAPITDAEVTVAMRRPDGTEAGQVRLTQNPANRQLYEARLTLPDAGVWGWTVAVSSPLGLESLAGNIEVVEGPSSGRGGFYLWIAVLAVLVIGGVLVWRTFRPRAGRATP